MPKQKGKNPGPPAATTPGQSEQDAELKAQQKAEKARRKAEYEATRAALVASEKAERDKLKTKKPAAKDPSQGQKSSSSSDAKTNATPKPAKSPSNADVDVVDGKLICEKVKDTGVGSTGKTIETTISALKSLDITSDQKSSASLSKKSSTTTAPSKPILTQKRIVTTSQSRVRTLFDHLPKGVDPRRLFEEPGINTKGIDSVFITLGLMYSHGQLHGSNNRVMALLGVVRAFIDSYTTPPEKDFRYEFPISLKKNLEFLRKCRPFAVAMNTTVEFINGQLRDIEIQDGKSEDAIKKDLSQALQDFGEERIEKAAEAIVAKAKGKIVQDDVVLVFGSSDLVRAVIVDASKATSFSLVVIDGRPYATERRAKGLDIITKLGGSIRHIKYTSITGLSNVIRSVTKVILGAHGLLTNGGVLAHAGTSQIALMASANNIPVIVCCETLKCCDKSPTDSFFLNEIGTGFGLSRKVTDSIGNECEPYLVTPVIKYDVTPPELVTAVITDVDILPCTSVPAVLRVQESRTTKLHHTTAPTRA